MSTRGQAMSGSYEISWNDLLSLWTARLFMWLPLPRDQAERNQAKAGS